MHIYELQCLKKFLEVKNMFSYSEKEEWEEEELEEEEEEEEEW